MASHCKKAASNKKGRRSADRRIRITTAPHAQTLPPEHASGAARATQLRRYRRHALRRARLSALRRGTRQALRLAQLRAAFVSVSLSLRCRNRLLASSSRPSRSAGEAGSEAARERSVWLRPQGPHPLCLTGAPSRQASLRSERRALNAFAECLSSLSGDERLRH